MLCLCNNFRDGPGPPCGVATALMLRLASLDASENKETFRLNSWQKAWFNSNLFSPIRANQQKTCSYWVNSPRLRSEPIVPKRRCPLSSRLVSQMFLKLDAAATSVVSSLLTCSSMVSRRESNTCLGILEWLGVDSIHDYEANNKLAEETTIMI